MGKRIQWGTSTTLRRACSEALIFESANPELAAVFGHHPLPTTEAGNGRCL